MSQLLDCEVVDVIKGVNKEDESLPANHEKVR